MRLSGIEKAVVATTAESVFQGFRRFPTTDELQFLPCFRGFSRIRKLFLIRVRSVFHPWL